MDYITIFVGVLLLVLSIPLLCGKASFLIAGYNTASEEKKAAYDEKKLSRYTGCMLLILSIGILIAGFFPTNLVMGIAYTVAIGLPLIMLFFLPKVCKKK